MKRAQFFTLCTVFLLCSASIHSEVRNGSAPPLALELDLARFMGNSGFTRVEVYQSVGRQGLSYTAGSGYSVAHFSVETIILKNDSTIFTHKTTQSDSVNETTEIKAGQQFVYTLPVFLPPGEYEVLTRLQDEVASRIEKKELTVQVANFSVDSLTFSDIQFATRVEKARGEQGMHEKNNIRVIPNPKAQFGEGHKRLTFYSELYNVGDSSGTYRVDYIIETQDGETLHTIAGKERQKADKHAAIFTAFDISDLATGIYLLRLVAYDDETGRQATTEKAFAVIWERDILAQAAEQQDNPYESLDEDALDTYFAKLTYIATSEEKDIFDELEQTGKQNFLTDFWSKRDPTPNTPINEFKDAYVERVVQANTHFSTASIEGWKTDRGRILLTYGAPDFIDQESETTHKKAFEIWHYNNLEGGTVFVFVDLKSNDLYELVHSTYRKELSRPDWESYLEQ